MLRLVKICVSFSLVFCILFCGCKATKKENASTTQKVEVSTTTAKQEKSAKSEKKSTTAKAKNTVDKKAQAIIQEKLPTDNGKWAVYYKNLKTGKTCSINNHKMVSASLIKLFIMAMVYDEIEKGNLEDTDEIEELMEKMITISHNDSSNELVAIAGGDNFKAGMKKVNAYAASIHCPDTEQQRNMLDSRPKPIPEQNYTSVKDCATLLEKIYHKKCVSPQADEKMLNYLLHQERTWKIPAGLPEGVKVANKTGELSTTENDVAIVFTDKGDYILCVISNELESTQAAQEAIRQISASVYEYVSGTAG